MPLNCCGNCAHIRKPLTPSYSKNPLPEVYLCAKHGMKRVELGDSLPCHVPWTQRIYDMPETPEERK